MSREAFEKWWAELERQYLIENKVLTSLPPIDASTYRGVNKEVCFDIFQAAQQEWIPYKEGDDVAYDTNALVTYEFLPLGCNEYGVTEAWFRSEGWETIDDEIIDNVTAYRQLPAPYGGE